MDNNNNKDKNPPKLAFWLLNRFLGWKVKYAALGDFEEIFYEILSEKGFVIASIWYWFQAIKSIPKFLIDKSYWGGVMLKNYIKLAVRNLLKNKQVSFINIFGLSIAIGCAIVSFVFFEFNYYRDDFHENAEKIFLVQNLVEDNNKTQLWSNSPLPIGEALKNDFPSVEDYVRINTRSGNMRYGDNVFNERLDFVDPEFFTVFTFPLLYGDKSSFKGNNAIILSFEAYEKYFANDVNPVGKQVSITFNGIDKESFLIKGVAKKLPDNSSFKFNICIPFEKQKDLGLNNFEDWSKEVRVTFIKVNNPLEIKTIEEKSDKYITIQNNADFESKMSKFTFEPLLKMAQNSGKARGGVVYIKLHPGQIWGMGFTGIFLLLLACFNYINIAVISASRRYKEVGIRKVIGSHKSNLIIQFLSENTILCFIALAIGILLSKYFFVPGFNDLYGVFQLKVDLLNNYRLLGFLIGLLLLTGIGAGLYPALYISSFQPAKIFRGGLEFKSKNKLSKTLLTFQIVLSIITLVYGVIFTQNTEYQKERDWGYNQEKVISIQLDDPKQFIPLRNSISSNKNIINSAGSIEHVGRNYSTASVEYDSKRFEVTNFQIGDNYIETLGIKLINGRSFQEGIKSDIGESIIVNETFIKELNIKNPIGERILYQEKPFYIIGIVKDFHTLNFMKKIRPFVFFKTEEKHFTYLSMLVNSGTTVETEKELKSVWKKLYPNSPYKGFFQDQIFDGYLSAMDGVANSSMFTSIVALLLTCMGIFGLVGLNIEKRMKEMSIRKVLGASFNDIIKLINKDFVMMFLVGAVIGVPASYFGVVMMLDSLWTYHQDISYFPFVFSIVLIVFSAGITIFSQILKSTKRNPVDYLRNE